MEDKSTASIHVAPLSELQEKGVMVVRGAVCPIAVFAYEEGVAAVDNRCPHLGFPLHKGSVRDGILTCHWHNARFDLCSGCTFDLFADDVPAFGVEVREGQVYVAATPRQVPSKAHYLRRLFEGMEQNVGLIQAKSLMGLLKLGTPLSEIIEEVALFGVRRGAGWNGLVMLTAIGNISGRLSAEAIYFALVQATRQTAADCVGRPPRRELQPLGSDTLTLAKAGRWFRYWVQVRQADAAERTLLTVIQNGATPAELADLIFSAATDRFYAGGGHVFDFCNKAFELLDLIGWEHAAAVLPTIVPNLVQGIGGEEMNAWRYPIDLVPPLRELEEALPALLVEGTDKNWDDGEELSRALLGDNPLANFEALRAALAAGARGPQLGSALCYAAALRLAQFGNANEVGDWFSPLHTFTFCNAVHQALLRSDAPEIVRGVLQGAIAVYLDRFLNVPPARLPKLSGPKTAVTLNGSQLLQQFLDHLDQRHDVDAAAAAVAAYLQAEPAPIAPLFDALTRATAREDLDFHSYQILDAAVRQCAQWQGRPQGGHILIGHARFLAAQCPTQRSRHHTAQIALRLHRGDNLYEEEIGADGTGNSAPVTATPRS